MITFLQDLAEKGIEVSDELKNTEEVLNDSQVFNEIVHLIDVIIWPIAVMIGLYMFKGQIGKVINNLGSIKAGASGIEMSFMDTKLEEATKLIGMGASELLSQENNTIITNNAESIIPKDGARIIPKNANQIIPEQKQSVQQKQSHADSPYQELIELEDAIGLKLKNLASQNGIYSNGSSNFALTSNLREHNIIDSHTASKLKMLIELNTLGLNSPKVNHDQVIKMKKLFNNINL